MPEAPWVSVRVTPSDAGDGLRAALMHALFSGGAHGVHEDGSQLVTHLPPGSDIATLRTALHGVDVRVTIEVGEVPLVDWSEAWKSSLDAHDLGTLVVTPPWLADRYDAGRTIVIDPGMAFGTGEHGTTRGVMRLLAPVLTAGDVVADLGAGSAVLAIAAAKLGASRVFAIELDGDAMPNARENVERNGVTHCVHLFEGDAAVLLPLLAPVHLVLANIISGVLELLLPTIRDALLPGGAAILSGILAEEREHMLAHFLADGWVVEAEDAEDIWWSVVIRRA